VNGTNIIATLAGLVIRSPMKISRLIRAYLGSFTRS